MATDSSRLAFYQVPLVPPEEGAEVSAEPLHVLVPGRSLGEVRRLLAGLEEPVVLRVSEHHVSFQTSTFLFFSRLIEGVFPDYRRVFPKEQQVRLTVDRLALLEALERIALVSRKGPAVVRLQVDGELQLESHGAEAGQASESVPVEELEGGADRLPGPVPDGGLAGPFHSPGPLRLLRGGSPGHHRARG